MNKRTKSEKELTEIAFFFLSFFLKFCTVYVNMAYMQGINACVLKPKEDFECSYRSLLIFFY